MYEYFKMACFDDADVAVFMPFTPVRRLCHYHVNARYVMNLKTMLKQNKNKNISGSR